MRPSEEVGGKGEPIRILLADDHALFREGLAGIINGQPDMQVVGEASDGVEALAMARKLLPDLVLMDIWMPGSDGLEATSQIRDELPGVTVVILTVREEEEKLFDAVKRGAQGYLLKSSSSRETLDMLRGAARGEAALPPMLASHLLEEFRRLSRSARPEEGEGPATLTPREREVLSEAAKGASDLEIAERLTVSLHTVKSHMRSILSKLHVSSRHEAARDARRRGLL